MSERPRTEPSKLTVGQIVSLWYSIRGIRFDGKPIIRERVLNGHPSELSGLPR